MKRYSAFPKAPALLESHHQIMYCHIQDIHRRGLTPLQWCSQCSLPLRDRVDRGAMVMKRYSAFLKAPALLESHHQIMYCHIQDIHRRGLTPLQWCSQCSLPLRDRVDRGAMVMKRYSAFPKAPALLESHHQIMYCHIQDIHRRGLTPLQWCSQCSLPLRDRVDRGAMVMKRYSAFPKAPALLESHHQIMYCHIQDIHRRGLTPLQWCSQCSLPLRDRVDRGAMVMKRYSAFPKAPALPESHHQIV